MFLNGRRREGTGKGVWLEGASQMKYYIWRLNESGVSWNGEGSQFLPEERINLAIIDFVASVSFDALPVRNNRNIFVFLKEKVEYIDLLLQTRQQPLLNEMLFLHIAPLKPILPHYRQQCIDGPSFSLLALTSPNFLQDLLFVCLVEGVDVPGLPILDPAEIEIREHLHRLVHITSYVICGLEDCPEKGLNYYLRFRFVVLEYNGAGLKSPPHRRHQNSINLYIPHLLLCFSSLQHPFLSYRHIHMFRVKFILQIFLSIFEQLFPILLGQFCIDPVGQRLCVSDEVNHQFWFIIRYQYNFIIVIKKKQI